MTTLDIDIRDFGAVLDGITDDAPAIQAAIRSVGTVTAGDNLSKLRGSVVRLPFGRIRIASTIMIDRACLIIGSGGQQSYAGTELLVDPNVSPVFHIVQNTITGSGEGIALRDFKVLKKIPQNDGYESVCVLAKNRFKLSDVSIGAHGKGFDVAVAIRASTGDVPPSNANCWMVEKLTSIGNKTTIHVQGNNTNAGVAIGCVASGPSSATWSYDDDSLLGNTYVACHASGTAAPGGGFRSGLTSTVNNHSVYVGCYNEGGTPNSFSGYATVIGGTQALSAGGISLVNGVSNKLQIGEAWGGSAFSPYRRIFNPKLQLEKYSHTSSPIQSENHPYEYEVRKSTVGQDGVAGWYLQRYTGTGFAYPWMWSDGDADVGGGHIWFPRGYYIGCSSNNAPTPAARIRVTSGNAAPTTGDWKRGDRVLNKIPTAGGYEGWICVAAGTPGTWKGFGLIQA